MDSPSIISNSTTNVFVGIAAAIILASMACGWLLRVLLLRTLRIKHPREFAELGCPSSRHLGSLLPRYGEMQIQFWRFLWSGKVFLMKDHVASGLASAALISDVTLGAGVVLLVWAAGK
jgi:hypothetical protein